MSLFPIAKTHGFNPVILALTIAIVLLLATIGRLYAQGPHQLGVDKSTPKVQVEAIEVTNTGDSGPGSLREAIETANANSGLDTINFGIPGDGPHTFRPQSPLPALTGSTVINGYTQPGSAKATNSSTAVLKLELNGTDAGEDSNGLLITGGGTTVRGLVINLFDGAGIRMESIGGNTVEGNYIGTDITGSLDLGNNGVGVWVYDLPSNRIGGTSAGSRNVISGNGSSGVFLYKSGSADNLVRGNYIGTDATGAAGLENYDGVRVGGASNNTVGGTTAGARNVISGNRFGGVTITRQNNDRANGNLVQGNYIGTNAAGNAVLGNGRNGVYLIQAGQNTIGGVSAGARNVISGNGFGLNNSGSEKNGIHILGTSAQGGDIIQGNYIGTDQNVGPLA